MGRRQSKRQPPYSSPARRPERVGWESDVISQVEQRAVPVPSAKEPLPVMHDISTAPYINDRSIVNSDAELADSFSPKGSVVHGYGAPVVDTRELELRELTLAVREADLQARRRETAREIRRIRKQTPKVEARLGDIELLIAELAQAVLQLGHAQHAEIDSPSTSDDDARCDDDALISELRSEVESLHHDLDSLRRQNEELAQQLAQGTVRHSINKSGNGDATLTWEQRKALLFSQDQESPSTLDTESLEESIRQELARLNEELESRDEELAQLRDLLEQRPTQCEEGTAVGAAAIAQMMDGDEMIREERQRLLDLQTEWESKFRQMEISASIERANLARERQQLERQNAELEEQLAHLKRELKQEEITGPNQSRRWLAKLGLAE
jgi:hypothetical protein